MEARGFLGEAVVAVADLEGHGDTPSDEEIQEIRTRFFRGARAAHPTAFDH
jgi:hypothetical protein